MSILFSRNPYTLNLYLQNNPNNNDIQLDG